MNFHSKSTKSASTHARKFSTCQMGDIGGHGRKRNESAKLYLACVSQVVWHSMLFCISEWFNIRFYCVFRADACKTTQTRSGLTKTISAEIVEKKWQTEMILNWRYIFILLLPIALLAEWLCLGMHEINSIRTESNTKTFMCWLCAAINMIFCCLYPDTGWSSNGEIKRVRSICMTTIRWHKNVNTLKSICIVCILQDLIEKRIPHVQTCEWYSNRLDVYYLAFYWKVLNFCRHSLTHSLTIHT